MSECNQLIYFWHDETVRVNTITQCEM